MDDPDIVGNKILKYLQPNGTRMYRYYFDESYSGTSLTMIARVRGENDPAFDRIFDLQWRNSNIGFRDELRMWGAESKFELEKADVEVNVNLDLYDWHTFRIAVDGATATIYVDENPEPVMSGVSTASSGDNYIKIGDGSGDAIGGYLDWCILDLSGAYAPGEGLAIPEGLEVDMYTTSVESQTPAKPDQYLLAQNYPNPFNPTTHIEFQLPESGHVTLSIYNTMGQLLETIIDAKMESGFHSITFDAAKYSSGIYFYKIKTANFNDVKKMLLLK